MRVVAATLWLSLGLLPGQARALDCEAVRCTIQPILATRCPCEEAASHGEYRRCIRGVLRELEDAGTLPSECKRAVRRCTSRSTCGRPTTVACQVRSRCIISFSPQRCEARGGTVLTTESCCASCGPAPSPTESPTPVATQTPAPGSTPTETPTAAATGEPTPTETPTAVATGEPTPTPTAIAAGALDPFLCYRAKVTRKTTKFRAVGGLGLVDAFGARMVAARSVLQVCAPTDVQGRHPDAPNHGDHLQNYRLREAKGSPKFRTVVSQELSNELGSVRMDLKKRSSLLVPTSTSLSGPPPIATAPTTLPFVCLQLKPTKKAPRFRPVLGVEITDRFETRILDVRKPTRLCAPADLNSEFPDAENQEAHLLCYAVRRHKGTARFHKVSPIFVNNRVAALSLDAVRPQELCLPTLRNP